MAVKAGESEVVWAAVKGSDADAPVSRRKEEARKSRARWSMNG